MKKVLLIDTNVTSFPMYQNLTTKGYDVYVISSKSTDCLSKYTKNYINADYSNIDVLSEIVKKHKFEYIIPGGNDVSYISAARLNQQNRFPGIDTIENTEIINNKIKFRKFAINHNLHVPKIYNKNDIKNLNTPIIVKPVDAYSGRGVSVIQNPASDSIDVAISHAVEYSKSKSYVIEDYIDGQLYSHSAFIQNKKIIHDFIVVENCTTNKFTVDTSHVVHDFPQTILKQIRADIEKISSTLNLVDGLIHTQFIRTKNSFSIIEITRRCPGDLYNLLIEKSTGFNYSDYYIRSFINESYGKDTEMIKKHIIRHTISSNKNLSFIGIKYNQPVNIDLFVPLITTGDELSPSPFGRVGILFLKCKSKTELNKIYIKTLQRGLYVI